MVKSSLLGPIIAVIGIIVLLAGYDLMTSSLNTWSLLTYDGGKLAEGGRVDRIVGAGAGETVQAAWYDAPLTKGSTTTALADNTYLMVTRRRRRLCRGCLLFEDPPHPHRLHPGGQRGHCSSPATSSAASGPRRPASGARAGSSSSSA